MYHGIPLRPEEGGHVHMHAEESKGGCAFNVWGFGWVRPSVLHPDILLLVAEPALSPVTPQL